MSEMTFTVSKNSSGATAARVQVSQHLTQSVHRVRTKTVTQILTNQLKKKKSPVKLYSTEK